MKARVEEYLSVYGLKVKPRTAARAGDQLRAFASTLDGDTVRREHLQAWRQQLEKRGLKAYTLQGYLGPLRGFLAWLYGEGYLLVNPYPKEWDERRARPGLRQVPSVKRMRALLDHISEASFCPVRDRTIVELVYSAGLRRAELAALNLQDLRGDWLFVRGKGGAERVVPLGSKAKAWLTQYLATERLQKALRFNPHEEALFLSWQGKRLGVQAYSYLVQRHRGRENPVPLHGLRHACASHMLAKGASIAVLQRLLGHRRLSTTQIYTQVETDSLQAVLKKYHPRG
jgi:site-specific recombinase XerD